MENYTPPGWLRIRNGVRYNFRTDRESGRILIHSRERLRVLRDVEKKFTGDAYNPEFLCFSTKQQKTIKSSGAVHSPHMIVWEFLNDIIEGVVRENENANVVVELMLPGHADYPSSTQEVTSTSEYERPIQEVGSTGEYFKPDEEFSSNAEKYQGDFSDEEYQNEEIAPAVGYEYKGGNCALGQGDREELKLKKATELLYVPLNQDPNHSQELETAAREMNKLMNELSNFTVNFDLRAVKEKVKHASTISEVCIGLWEEHEIRRYFSVLENANILSDLLQLSSLPDNPLLDPVPDRKKSTYADLFFYGLKHCRPLMLGLVNIVKADKGNVEPSDVVTVAFYFSCLAHLASRKNSSITKTKSLLLRKQGLSEKGLNGLAKLGITETDRNLRNHKYMLADLSETHFLAQVAAGLPYQETADNLDKAGHHLTQAYLELERQDTSSLDTQPQPYSKIPEVFALNSLNLYSESNKHLKDHMMYAAAISVGKRLAQESSTAKTVILKHLPTHHRHKNSDIPKNRAILVIKNPEYLQETQNAEFVEYLRREQWDFLVSISEAVEDKGIYLEDLELMRHASEMDTVETEDEIKKREKAEERTKKAVSKFGEWIGHGDALTFKMFWLGAKSLCQGGVTALERLDFLNIFRMQLLHLKFNKVYMEYSKMLPKLNNIMDSGTLAEMKAILPGLDKISNVDKEISKSFEVHDQFFSAVFQAKVGDAWKHYLQSVPEALNQVNSETSAIAAILAFLNHYDIEFTYDPDRVPVEVSKYDDLQQYDREGIAMWILSVLLDDGEAEEDSELLEALRLTLIFEFLNKNSSGHQTSKYAYLLLLDRAVELLASERSLERMNNLVCVNPSGQLGGGLFRDKVNEHVVRAIKEVLDSLGISEHWGDLDIQKIVASVTPASLVTEHDMLSSGFPNKYKQHSSDLLGEQKREVIRQHVAEIATFSSDRSEINDFMVKPRGSPFHGLTKAAVNRFLSRNLSNFYRNFPRTKTKS